MKKSGRKKRGGFTLTETMVSLVMFVIITLFGYHIFRADQKSYVEQEEVTNMQQQARSAMEQLTSDLRIAGSGVPSGGVSSDIGLLFPVEPGNAGSILPDTMLVLANFNKIQSDLAAPMPNESAEIKVEDSSQFSIGALAIITGATLSCGEAGEVFQITHISDDGTNMLQHNSRSPWNSDQKLFCSYIPPATVLLVNYRKYYIDDTDPEHPRLMLEEDALEPQVIADNIENLQLEYDLVTGERDMPDPDSPGAIRKATITIVARTNTPDPEWPHGVHSVTGESDNYRRVTLTSDIQIRNLKRW
jgi:prepilin-type N-terminal cleavage/methylation domain-containing protein